MAETLIPEIIPGLVAVEYTGADNEKTGEKKGTVKNVFPIDAKELMMSGKYKLVENGAVEAARINANPLRSTGRSPTLVAAEVTGIAGQVFVAPDEKTKDELVKAADHGGEPTPRSEDDQAPKPVARQATPEPAKAAGTPTGAKNDSDKK